MDELRNLKTKPRKPDALLRGKCYKVDSFLRVLSQFPDKRTGECPFKRVAIYPDFKMKFHTFLPKEFDNKSEQDVKDYNKEIADGKNIRIVYYGKIGVSYEIDALKDGEDKDEEKEEGIRLIEDSERGLVSLVKRAASFDSNTSIEGSASKFINGEKELC